MIVQVREREAKVSLGCGYDLKDLAVVRSYHEGLDRRKVTVHLKDHCPDRLQPVLATTAPRRYESDG